MSPGFNARYFLRVLHPSSRKRDYDAVLSNCRLPAELWLDIFQRLDLSYIKVMSLVCKTLRSLSLPFMFRDLSLCIAPPRGQSRTQWYHRRLEVYTSGHIRHLVRKCTLGITGLLMGERGRDPNCSAIIIKQYLRHFSHLEELHYHQIIFNEESLKALQSLSALTSLTMWACTVPALAPSSSHLRLRLRHLVIMNTKIPDWGVLLDPDILETFVFSHGTVPSWLFTRALPNLRRLSLAQCEIAPGFSAMPEFPQLETLTHYPSQTRIPFSGAQKLKEYKGSLGSLVTLLRGGAIQSLSLPLPLETREMPRVLCEVALFNPQLRSLRINPAYLSHGLLEVICKFPALCDLEIRVHACTAEPSDDIFFRRDEVVIKLLSLQLPLLIERIYISYGASLTEELDIQSYWHPLSTWVGRHPKLRFAKIPGWGVWERGDSMRLFASD